MDIYVQKAYEIIEEVKKVIVGKDECLAKVMAAILAGGHVLLEDVPGVGKTEMALAFSRAMNLKQNRVQFTPDVLPADITGFSVYQKTTEKFVYQPGAAMCNLLLADEINRTSPKTQSALLEVMEEGSVTVDGVTRQVPRPFVVLATQNPTGSYGTQFLPESQMDRFMICTTMGYPSIRDEIRLLKERHRKDPLDKVTGVIHENDLLVMQQQVDRIFIHDVMYSYMVELSAATRNHPLLELGVSPRGTLALSKMSKAFAFLKGREYVLPEDVKQCMLDVMGHRVRINGQARVTNTGPSEILQELLEKVQAPRPGRKSERKS